jgi:hypothetical protein
LEDIRYYPVEFEYKFRENMKFELTIPEGYSLDEYPRSIEMSMQRNELEFKFELIEKDNGMTFRSEIKINQPEIQISSYKDLQRFARIVSETLNSPIILQRVN